MGRPSRSPRAALALATIALVLLTCAPRPALASPSSGDATDLRLLDDATSRAAASSGVAPPAPLATTTTGAADAPPPPGKPGFEKTLAAQVDNMLAKEFKDADASANAGVLGEGAGKSFNRTVIAEGATLETVARVRRAGGGHELEREGGSGGGGGDGVGGGGHDASGGGGGAGVGGGGSGGSGGSGGDGGDGAGSKFNAGGDGGLELPRDHVSAGAFIERTIRDALHTGAEEEDVERLVDAKDNEFVISNPKSGTMELQQDLRLIRDLVVVLVAAAIGAVAFTMMGQPLITGYLVAGAAVGPGGLGLVVELVQVETLAQFGIIFLLFTLGVEFSYAKLKHVQGVALGGGLAEIALMMLVCGVVSNFTGAELKEGVFVGAFLSMSSTAVCVKCLAERKARSPHTGPRTTAFAW
ncbi:monovalent Cation:Proton antiporter-2 family [Micromonas pusilla CCMP1545]|uniref:Monovalent Cation:Proton antiporter-2 family n=1 Tax=Micromonas pusilla (strain CCMP1545) TaxID=564608 RepID=C1N5M8_MICPC|nr:monovalent Cation:Proton antiporter-2 family [Micromonas pusilla CCMP1545]EEH52527.1 monovalent Cation:Proton antiporter-2 family [Micromonas pusilla CCMP1545]|eukprot:XP_003063391.1 monovalent Cation:Proton antiporter-2 family [Micromonas pusilla CCMP1545]